VLRKGSNVIVHKRNIFNGGWYGYDKKMRLTGLATSTSPLKRQNTRTPEHQNMFVAQKRRHGAQLAWQLHGASVRFLKHVFDEDLMHVSGKSDPSHIAAVVARRGGR
jgi:hypothetical protein